MEYVHTASLRRGWTTGSCAACSAQAATVMLLTGKAPASVSLTTPIGIPLDVQVERAAWEEESAVCSVRKDAGDDPDVTNGVLVSASVRRVDKAGVCILGGEGVGRVTKPGLACPVGEAAINPVPRAQITAAVEKAVEAYGYMDGLEVTISVENGAEIAKQTYNEQLGIIGGLSILGTSGIVEPMSEQALMDTTHLALDSRYANGQKIAFLCPGNYGADFSRDVLGLDLGKAVKCSNFIGDALDWAVYRGFPDVLLIGHAGKLAKLAAGVMNTHSSVADGRKEIFTAHAALCGASIRTLSALMEAVSVDACIDILDKAGLRQPVLERIGNEISERLAHRIRGRARIEYIMFTNKFGVLAQSAGAMELCGKLREKGNEEGGS